MQPIKNQAEQTIAYQQERLSPYLPLLAITMAKTYLVPFGGLLIANTVILLLRMNIPGLFAGTLGSLASLLIFFVILYYGWRFAEGRWGGTALFVSYTAVSKARRALQNELQAPDPSDAVIQEYMSDYIQLTDHFVDTMHANDLVPEFKETD